MQHHCMYPTGKQRPISMESQPLILLSIIIIIIIIICSLSHQFRIKILPAAVPMFSPYFKHFSLSQYSRSDFLFTSKPSFTTNSAPSCTYLR